MTNHIHLAAYNNTFINLSLCVSGVWVQLSRVLGSGCAYAAIKVSASVSPEAGGLLPVLVLAESLQPHRDTRLFDLTQVF